MMLTDDHLHTKYSDGKNTPLEMIESAIAIGYERITFSDHVRANTVWFKEYIEEVKKLKKKFKSLINIEIAVECKVLDFLGHLDCPGELLENDSIKKIAALHRLPTGKGDFIGKFDIRKRKTESLECYFSALKGLKNIKEVSRIAHPFSLMRYFGIDQFDNSSWCRIKEILHEIKIPIEYNVKYDNSLVPENLWIEFADTLYFGSDSHSVEELCFRSKELVSKEKNFGWILNR